MKTLKKQFQFKRTFCTKPYSFCLDCGTKSFLTDWPRECDCCKKIVFKNPIPVAVGLLPFTNGNEYGILLIKRAIPPFVDEYCLPGGFVDYNESWQEAIAREVLEETTIKTNANEYNLIDTCSTPDNSRILIFGISNQLRHIKQFENFIHNTEVSAIKLGSPKDKLCFSLHEKVYINWFNGKWNIE